MKSFIRIMVVSLLMMLIFVSSPNALEQKMTLEQAIQLADVIVQGEVVYTDAQWVDDERGMHIYTYAKISIYSYLKGEGKKEIVVELPGGTVGEITEHVSPSVSVVDGEEVILLLSKDGLRPAAGSYSKYVIERGKARGALGSMNVEILRSRIRELTNANFQDMQLMDDSQNISNGIEHEEIQREKAEVFNLIEKMEADPDAPTPLFIASSVIYDNTNFEDKLWYSPGPTYEILDFGSSDGGKVIKFKFNYVTTLPDPGSITIRFYTGTNSQSRGNFLTGFIFSKLQGSPNKKPISYIITVELPANMQFTLPSGEFGYSYQFSNSSTGVRLATGGNGIMNMFWKNETPAWFGGDPFASFYMKIYKQADGNAPIINSINPASGSAGTGTSVTITGSNFGSVQGEGSVNFFYRSGQPTISAPVTSWSDTSIECTVPVDIVNGYPASSSSGPVTVTRDSGLTGNGYTFIVTFGYDGRKWPGSWPVVEYWINDNTSDCEDEALAVEAAANAWNNAGAAFTFQYAGSHPGTVSDHNYKSEILWGTLTSPSNIAGAWCWSNGSEFFYECDIVFNDPDYDWNTSGNPSKYQMDVQTIAAHELGHWFRLRDLYGNIGDGLNDNGKIMDGFGSNGEVKTEITDADREGIIWIYGTGCNYSISPTSELFPAEGGTGSVSVTTNKNECKWTAVSNDNWIIITSGDSGSGSGTVDYSVEMNTGFNQRKGTMTIAGETFPVTQAGAIGDAIGVYRAGAWYLDKSCNGQWDGHGIDTHCTSFGLSTDQAVAGDWNNDGFDDIGVFRNGAWYLDYDGNRHWDGCGTDKCVDSFGLSTDQAVAGDWNNDGADEIGVFRNGAWYLDDDGNGHWDGCGTDKCVDSFGLSTDQAVAGDWNNDGIHEIGVFRKGAWYLDYNGNGHWDGCGTDKCVDSFGLSTDQAVAGDWNNDGADEIGVFRNGAWYLDYNGNGHWEGGETDITYYSFGYSVDRAVVGRW